MKMGHTLADLKRELDKAPKSSFEEFDAAVRDFKAVFWRETVEPLVIFLTKCIRWFSRH